MTVDTLTEPVEPATDGPDDRRPRRRYVWLGVALVLVVALGFGVRAVTHYASDIRTGTEAVSPAQFAARTGAKVTLLGVTADGGMIEFRYQVVDPDKASLLVHQDDLRPALVAEDTGATLVMLSPPHNHKADLKVGQTYYFLMANTNSAIKDGTKVTIVVGDVRLEHVVARS